MQSGDYPDVKTRDLNSVMVALPAAGIEFRQRRVEVFDAMMADRHHTTRLVASPELSGRIRHRESRSRRLQSARRPDPWPLRPAEIADVEINLLRHPLIVVVQLSLRCISAKKVRPLWFAASASAFAKAAIGLFLIDHALKPYIVHCGFGAETTKWEASRILRSLNT